MSNTGNLILFHTQTNTNAKVSSKLYKEQIEITDNIKRHV